MHLDALFAAFVDALFDALFDVFFDVFLMRFDVCLMFLCVPDPSRPIPVQAVLGRFVRRCCDVFVCVFQLFKNILSNTIFIFFIG